MVVYLVAILESRKDLCLDPIACIERKTNRLFNLILHINVWMEKNNM